MVHRGNLAIAFVFALALPAPSQTWTGVVSGNWSVGGNWSPAAPSSGPNTALTFGASPLTALTNDVAGGLILNRIAFTAAAPAYVISGGNLDFRSSTSGVGPSIAFDTANAVTLGSILNLTNILTVAGSGAGTLTLGGKITGPNGIVLDASGTLRLSSGANDFAGPLIVNQGTLLVGADGGVVPAGKDVTVAATGVFDTGGSNNSAAPIGDVLLNGGTLRATTGASNYHLNRVVTGTSGGTISLTGTGPHVLHFTGAGAGIEANADGSWSQASAAGGFVNDTAVPIDFVIAPGKFLFSDIRLGNGALNQGFRITGGGTLAQGNRFHDADLTIGPAQYNFSDVTSAGGIGSLTTGNLTLDGGTLTYTGLSATMSKPFHLAAGGGTIEVERDITTLTLASVVTGSGRLTKSGRGVLFLANTTNLHPGGITIDSGRVDVTSDNRLGLGDVIVNPAGMLRYAATTLTARTFRLNGGSIEVPAGITLALSGADVNGGFLRGTGTYRLSFNTLLAGVTTFGSTVMTVIGPTTTMVTPASFLNFTHGGSLTLDPGLMGPC